MINAAMVGVSDQMRNTPSPSILINRATTRARSRTRTVKLAAFRVLLRLVRIL